MRPAAVILVRDSPDLPETHLKIGFVSLGCPKNLVDSEVMMGQLVARGHELTAQPGQADVLAELR